MHRIVLAGSVNSSFATLKKLVEHQTNVVGVLGYEPENTGAVSGYVSMRNFCEEQNIPYFPFTKISAESTKKILADLQPDIFFVTGLSQIVPADMLAIARLGNIGFHPTALPRGRGRAPLAWLVLEEKSGAANFFLMSEGVDDGPLFVQSTFPVTDEDTAASVEEKMLEAIDLALDQWLPELKMGKWEPVPQDESYATYYAKRTMDDGWINWALPAANINRLIRASGPPHPGAYSFLKDNRITILNSRINTDTPIKGVTGTVLLAKNNEYLIQAGDGLLWISGIFDEGNTPVLLKVGDKLGYYTELELYKLRNELKTLKQKLGI